MALLWSGLLLGSQTTDTLATAIDGAKVEFGAPASTWLQRRFCHVVLRGFLRGWCDVKWDNEAEPNFLSQGSRVRGDYPRGRGLVDPPGFGVSAFHEGSGSSIAVFRRD